jgi:hypothetical protein
VNDLIYSKFPKETFSGTVKYVFEAPGQMQSSSHRMGTEIENQSNK